ncbi:hemolysin family protein [Dietzia sp.]|uniref:hemolysin family protein n=1 Tax=Dietzia sp. TaxID=1871616 RepID=UPI002FDA7795
MSDLWAVLLTLLLVGFNAFFVSSEFAMISSRRDRLEALVAQGKKRAKTVIAATEKLSLMMAASQLGITVCSILLGKVGEPAIGHLFEPLFELAHVPESLVHPISFVIAMAIVVLLHVLLGEMVPKNVAIAGPEITAMYVVPIHLAISRVVSPIIRFCNWSANIVLRAFGVEPKDELDAVVTPAELSSMLADSHSSGLLDNEEHTRLAKALDNENRTVSEVMIPRQSVRTVRADTETDSAGVPVSAIRAAAAETGFSRFPVLLHGNEYQGYVHVKDTLAALLADREAPGTSGEEHLPLSAIHAMPSIAADELFETALGKMRRTSSHIGNVVDPRGYTVGIVALEDLIEEFVGTVRDGTHYRRNIPGH